ncbi:nitroreductase [Parendozoicomonas haliclonae]|uniref:NADH dehydrogenase n=1 Tax=Parendozoicomonas haliclonae TaxID=1960125 RepID=A0A1X7ADT7_9GAMM|nr:nitroreductase [Parendozoicomonas haliclonae]SMA32107.1 NADH dehydrogenase [Parendozoicomonas haliclonae]
MDISSAVLNRRSCRGFKQEPVSEALLREIFSLAQQAPSGCNVQPWQVIVVSGEKKDQLKNQLMMDVMQKQKPYPDFDWSVAYSGKHKERQFGSADALYSAMGIERQDKMQRNIAMMKNWAFFDAPHVAIFTMDKYLNLMGAVDIGIYAQTLSLLMMERGISNCMQGALGQFPGPIREMFDLPEERGVIFGMSFGYADNDVPANTARTSREALEEAVLFAS